MQSFRKKCSQLIGFINQHEKLHIAFCSIGIIGSLVVYGWLQERVMQWPYDGEKFEYIFFIVLCNRMTSFFLAVGILLGNIGIEQSQMGSRNQHRGAKAIIAPPKEMDTMKALVPIAPLYQYALISLSNVVATSAQYEALRHISFPLQSLAKCGKMLPVMAWSFCIAGRKRYEALDYTVAFIVMIGCGSFFMSGKITAEGVQDNFVQREGLYGAGMMVLYLVCDGFTSTYQDRMFKQYNMSTFNQIMYINLWSSIISTIGLLLSGEMIAALLFVRHHMAAFWNILTLSMAASIGQLFISHTIQQFGALLLATIMTTRQVFSIILSTIIFGHPLSGQQWASVAVVFGVLYYKSWAKDRGKRGKQGGGDGERLGRSSGSDIQQVNEEGRGGGKGRVRVASESGGEEEGDGRRLL